MEVKENVNHPGHYGGDTTYECIKVLKAWMSEDEYKGFLKGNAIKYLCRTGKKDDTVQDLRKAVWYIERLVESTKEKASALRKETVDELTDKFRSSSIPFEIVRDKMGGECPVNAVVYYPSYKDYVVRIYEDKNGKLALDYRGYKEEHRMGDYTVNEVYAMIQSHYEMNSR